MGKIRIRDGKNSEPGSGINIPDPQHWINIQNYKQLCATPSFRWPLATSMPVNDANNTGAEQQPQAGERAPPPVPVLPTPPDQVTPHKVAVVQLILDYCEYRKVNIAIVTVTSLFPGPFIVVKNLLLGRSIPEAVCSMYCTWISNYATHRKRKERVRHKGEGERKAFQIKRLTFMVIFG